MNSPIKPKQACPNSWKFENKMNMPEIKYDVFVKTGDLDCAGTDANVFINIVGKDGNDNLRIYFHDNRLFD